jgi:hypothetical protein
MHNLLFSSSHLKIKIINKVSVVRKYMNRWIIVVGAALVLLVALCEPMANVQGRPSGYQMDPSGLYSLMGQPFEPMQTSNQSMPANNVTTLSAPITNFTQQIAQQISPETYFVDVAYESPKTVILQGSDARSAPPPQHFVFNDLLWRAVDLLKDQGFEIDQIDLLPTGEDLKSYRIYMSLE